MAFGIKEAVKLADGGQAPGLRGRGETRLREIVEISRHVAVFRFIEPSPAPFQKRHVIGEIAAISGQRVGLRAALGAHHLQEGFDEVGIGSQAGITSEMRHGATA